MIELTDLEICKRISDIEGVYAELLVKQKRYNARLVHIQEKAEITRWFNPLTDDALCFRLMVKYRISFCHDYVTCVNKYVCFQNSIHRTLSRNASANRAICLAIIKVAHER